MNNKIIFYLSSIGIIILAIITQSVVFPLFTKEFMPDISLIAIIYFSINWGKNFGQITGFVSGLVLDSLSGVPFGLNTMVRLIMGYSLGFFKGKIFLDKILLPSILILLCTFSKYILILIISLIFPVDFQIKLFSLRFLIEVGMNIVLTPVMFFIFNLIKRKLKLNREI